MVNTTLAKVRATPQRLDAETESQLPHETTGDGIKPDWHRQMIAEAAYYRAEKRGFQGGDAVEDWLAAEAEIDALVKGNG